MYHTQCTHTYTCTHHRNSASMIHSMAVFPNHHHQKSSDCQIDFNSRSRHPPCLLFHSNCQTSLTVMKSSRISMAFLLRLYWVVLPAVTSSLTTCHRSGSTCLTVNRRRMTLTDSPKKNCMLYRVYAWSSTKKKRGVLKRVEFDFWMESWDGSMDQYSNIKRHLAIRHSCSSGTCIYFASFPSLTHAHTVLKLPSLSGTWSVTRSV